jgi:hypothetical protein
VMPASNLCDADRRHPHHRASCVAAVGVDDRGGKHTLALIAGATENGLWCRRRLAISHRAWV